MSRSFSALLRHFFLQFFRVETGTEGGFNATAILALLASPGLIMACLLFAKYSSFLRWFHRNFNFDREISSQPDKYTFIVLSMTVTALVVVLRWESMFPDRRDFANLTPLPLSNAKVLMARTLALTAFMVLFLVTVNAASTFLFPGVVMEREGTTGEVFRFMLAHAITVIAAGLWSFAAFLALTGLLMALLPYRVFQRIKRYVQFASVLGLVLFFASASTMTPAIAAMRNGQPVWADWLPSAWFLGLYQVLRGKPAGTFEALAGRVLPSLTAVCLLAVVAYTLSYRWFYLKSAETVEGSSSPFPIPRFVIATGCALLPKDGFCRAVLPFVLRTLARSDAHTAVLASVAGFGIAIAVLTVNLGAGTEPVPMGLLAATLIVVYALLTGLRLCFGFPTETRANWIFRLGSDESTAVPDRVIRVVMYLFVAPPILIFTVATGVLHGWGPALMHGVFSAATAFMLTQALTADFRVIPFTSAWMPGQDNLPRTVALWLVGVAAYGQGLAALDLFLMRDPVRLLVFLGASGFALYLLRTAPENREPMVWSDTRGDLDLLRIGE